MEDIISPLAQIDDLPSIDELFDRDPLELSPQEIERICEEFRSQAISFKKDEEAKAFGTKKRVVGTGRKSSKKKLSDAELDNLLLDLKLD